MSEKFPVATAKKPDELAATYAKVKSVSKDFGLSAVAELKSDQVKKAMTDGKKGADFLVEVDIAKTMIVQLYCEVKGQMRTVLGRSEIKSIEDYNKAKALGKSASLNKAKAEMFGGK